MTAPRSLAWALAAAAGALSVAGYAPFAIPVLPLAALTVLFTLWNGAASGRAAAALGFAFGIGVFGAGVSWLFIAVAGFGEMPPFPAALATAGVVAYLSLWPALAGWLAARFTRPGAWRFAASAGAWTATEWLRGYVFTGMPWLALGYSQLPGSPLAAYAPLGGVFLVSLAGAIVAACTAGGVALSRVRWTVPYGSPLAVSLVQGNITQDVKFDRAFRERTFEIYGDLVRQTRGRLVVLPESAFPMFADQVPAPVVVDLAKVGAQRDGLVLLGLFTAEPPLPGSDDERYYNTVAALGAGDVMLYRKRHLVPFGESIPFKSLLAPIINGLLQIPLADQTAGAADQPAFVVGDHRIAVNICYEDAFGGELIGAARKADILVNVTNDAWYGHSVAAYQHNQISAMRALELGRPMLRATNTGITSSIDAEGRELARLPWFTRGVLEVEVRGHEGLTPYARAGDGPVLALCVVLIAIPALASRRAPRTLA